MAGFEETYRANRAGLWLLVSRHRNTQEDREDLLGEVALELCKRFDEYDPSRGKFLTWAGRIVLSRACAGDKYASRKKRTATVVSFDDLPEWLRDRIDTSKADPFDLVCESELRDIVAQTLSGNQRRVVMKIMEARFQADVADELGLCRAAIRPILRRVAANPAFMSRAFLVGAV